MRINKLRTLIIGMFYFVAAVLYSEVGSAANNVSWLVPAGIVTGGAIAATVAVIANKHKNESRAFKTQIIFVGVDGNNIFINPGEIKTISVKNIGTTNWQNAKIDWIDGVPLANVRMQNNTCDNSNLAPNATCTFELVAENSVVPGNSKILRVSGTNINNNDYNVIIDGNLAVTLETLPQYQHLIYRAVDVVNATNGNAILTNITSTISNNLTTKIKYCAPGDADCEIQTDANCVSGGVLIAHANCHLWFKAKPDTTALSATVAGTVNVSANGTWAAATAQENNQLKAISNSTTFNIAYDNALYVGGNFYRPATLTYDSMEKWNGTAWQLVGSPALATDPVSTVYNLIMFKGDLYAGGGFEKTDSAVADNIAVWNGDIWNEVGVDGGADKDVGAFATKDGILYVGGYFTDIGNAVDANGIAAWDGTRWSHLGAGIISAPSEGVTALEFFNNKLYAGGYFSTVSGTDTNGFASWDGTSWTAIPGFLPANRYIYSITPIGQDLYVGGEFTTAPGSVAATGIAKYNSATSTWEALGSGLGGFAFAASYANLGVSTGLYVGGYFTTAGGASANYIAKWDGGTWSPLGPGMDYYVTSLAAIGNDLYVGGWFDFEGGLNAYEITRWDGLGWNKVGSDIPFNNFSFVGALLITPSIVITSGATK